MKKILLQGAEAVVSLKDNIIMKERISKGYRIKEIDERLRKSRTKSEAKLLEKAGKIIRIPNVIGSENFEIKEEFIDGGKLSEMLNRYDEKKQIGIMKKIGEAVKKLHENNIIHGDLTTSNMILKNSEVYFVDFGLGFISARIEDKAVDLHLLKQALEAKHFENYKKLFESFLESYNDKEVLERLKKVELRGRYKQSLG